MGACSSSCIFSLFFSSILCPLVAGEVSFLNNTKKLKKTKQLRQLRLDARLIIYDGGEDTKGESLVGGVEFLQQFQRKLTSEIE